MAGRPETTAGDAAALEASRSKVLRVVFVSLVIDLLSFTFILPLLPKLLEFYRDVDARNSAAAGPGQPETVLSRVLGGINAYKNAFSRPISDRYDVVLLGGLIGSLFSACQVIASPAIGALSDRFGRRRALLWSLAGNILSVALWLSATDFRTFLASRIVGGLSEGNVQLANAIAADVSDPSQRGRTMAMVGVCFSIAFTFGPAIGAALSRWTVMMDNPFGTTAAVSLGLLVIETAYIYFCLPETLPALADKPKKADEVPTASTDGPGDKGNQGKQDKQAKPAVSLYALHLLHFFFILFFSGMEFSLPFMTYDLFGFDSMKNGRLLGLIGIVSSAFQGSLSRRVGDQLDSRLAVKIGTASCTAAFFILSSLQDVTALYGAAVLLALTSATVVSGLNSIVSVAADKAEQGRIQGRHRSWGQLGRALGPILFCSLYWWAGRQSAYVLGGSGMLAVSTSAYAVLSRH